jgi:hypothetical protein
MFKSKQRPIVVPQWEHEKLAGTLALLWGNADFERPPVPFESFVTGVALHDRAYGHLDNWPILETPEAEWLALARRGFDAAWADPVGDVIVKLHLQRLVSYGSALARQAEAAAMRAEIDAHLQRHGLDRTLFDRIDRITRLCDDISFAFCFEAPASGAVKVFPRWDHGEEIEMSFRVAEGVIVVDPWPFGAPGHMGYLVGYQLEGFPEVLEPVMLRYELLPAAHSRSYKELMKGS